MASLATLPWTSIIAAIFSFLLSKSSGKSTGTSAAIAGAVGLGTYFLADPSNVDNLFGVGQPDTSEKATAPVISQDSSKSASGSTNWADLGSKVVTTTGETLQSWGPTGTAAVIGTTALASSDSLTKYLPWGLGLAAAYIILK